MKRQVKFYWWNRYKIWEVSGNTISDIVMKCWSMCYRYNAMHFEVLD